MAGFNDNRSFITLKQKELLVEFMEKNPDLRSGQFTASFTRQTGHKLWVEISQVLNTLEGGARKSWEKWRKVYMKNTILGNVECTSSLIFFALV